MVGLSYKPTPNQIQVNAQAVPGGAPNPSNGFESNPVASVFPNGSVLVAYETTSAGSQGRDINLRFLDPVTQLPTPIILRGAPFQPTSLGLANREDANPQTILLNNSGDQAIPRDRSIVVWQSTDPAGNVDVFYNAVKSNGDTLFANPQRLTFGGQFQNPSVTTTADGGAVITVQNTATGAVFAHILNAQLFPAQRLNIADTSVVGIPPVVSSLPDGNFVASWTTLNAGAGLDAAGLGVALQRFTFNGFAGQKLGSPIQANATSNGNQSFSQIVTLANGSFVVAWQNADARDPDGGITFRIFDKNGAPVNADETSIAGVGLQFQPAITALPLSQGGGFVVGWSDVGTPARSVKDSLNNTDAAGFAVKAQAFTADGTPIGGDVIVNKESTIGAQQNVYLTSNSVSGDVLALFEDFNFNNVTNPNQTPDTGFSGIYAENLILTVTPPTNQPPTNQPPTNQPPTNQPSQNNETAVNRDANTDIIWHNNNGQSSAWAMNGSEIISGNFVTAGGSIIAPGPEWEAAGTGDFNGDGLTDLLWRRNTGQLDVWTMNGNQLVASNTILSGSSPATPGTDWSIADVADFNNDGRSDILWRNTSGRLDLWTMNGAQLSASNTISVGNFPVTPGSDWTLVDSGDFNANGTREILWRNSTTGQLDLWTMNGAQLVASNTITSNGSQVTPGSDWSIVGVDDFTGDDKADLLWRNVNGSVDLWTMNGAELVRSDHVTSGGVNVAVGADWQVKDVGDYNGNGRADVLWQNDNGSLDIWSMNGSQLISSNHVTQQGVGAIYLDQSWNVIS